MSLLNFNLFYRTVLARCDRHTDRQTDNVMITWFAIAGIVAAHHW